MAKAIIVSHLYFKKLFFTFAVLLFSFVCISPAYVHAQVAVPVIELPGSPLLLTTIAVMNTTSATSWNTAYLAAKETGLGFYTPPGASVPVPITGAQVAAQGVANPSADNLTTILVKPLIRQFTNSLVQWINNGFQGSPMFVTDPAGFFIGVADRIAGNFIEGSELGFLCEPFRFPIRLALNLNYSARFEDEIGCTLSDVINNVEGFTKDFSQGGFQAWFSMTQNPQNNPYGAYIQSSIEMDRRLMEALDLEEKDLNWGQGFLSWRECIGHDIDTQECTMYGPTQTPGTVINTQLEDALGSDLAQLELADEFDEIIAALIGQLFSQVQQGLINA